MYTIDFNLFFFVMISNKMDTGMFLMVSSVKLSLVQPNINLISHTYWLLQRYRDCFVPIV